MRTGEGEMFAPTAPPQIDDLDEVERMLIAGWKKKGKAAMLREVARLLDEEAEPH